MARRFAALVLVAGALPHAARGQAPPSEPVAGTPHFAFYSDFATNLNDALIAAGNARRAGGSELFRSGEEQACFAALPPSERAAWDEAVDYYAAVLSPEGTFSRPRTLLRLGLLFGGSDWARGEERRFVELAALFREAAAIAYRACRWAAQDAANRRWIEAAVAGLAMHSDAIAARLTELYGTTWADLPLRVDVVATVSAQGADSIFVRPPPNHVLVGSGVAANQGDAALEVLFHEASHFLTGPGSPLLNALAGADDDRLWHVVLFYMTGETVRRTLADAGVTDYVPYMYARDLFGDVRDAVAGAFEPYLDGQRTLEEAAARLLGARGGAPAAPGTR